MPGGEHTKKAAPWGTAFSILVARAGIEPATFRFSGGRSYQLSYLAEAPGTNAKI